MLYVIQFTTRMNLMADDLFGSRGVATNQNSYFSNDFYYQHDDSDDGDHDKYGLDAFRRVKIN